MRRPVPVRSLDASMRHLDVFVYLWCPLLRVCSYWGPQGYPRQGHNMPRPGIFNMLPSIINIVAPLAQYAAKSSEYAAEIPLCFLLFFRQHIHYRPGTGSHFSSHPAK
jgi:hypothetical protein